MTSEVVEMKAVRTPLAPSTVCAARPRGQTEIFVGRLRRHRGAAIGLSLFASLVVLAIVGPVLTPYDPTLVTPANQLLPPSLAHLMGTDNFGRDTFTRVLYGARVSLEVGLVSVLISMTGGVTLGLVSGYYGGWIDFTVMRFIDILLSFPSILLALSIVAVLGPNLTNALIAVGIAGVPVFTRLTRGSVLSARRNVYVDAARVVGCPTWKIMVRHILPNVVAPLIVVGTLGVGSGILAVAALSFLGMGVQPPTAEWGAMLTEGRQYMQVAWWLNVFPGVAIMLTVLAVNMFGDGLRDVVDPRLRI